MERRNLPLSHSHGTCLARRVEFPPGLSLGVEYTAQHEGTPALCIIYDTVAIKRKLMIYIMNLVPRLNVPDSRNYFEREIKLACHLLTLVNLGPEKYIVDDAQPHTIDGGWFTVEYIIKIDDSNSPGPLHATFGIMNKNNGPYPIRVLGTSLLSPYSALSAS